MHRALSGFTRETMIIEHDTVAPGDAAGQARRRLETVREKLYTIVSDQGDVANLQS